MSKTVFGKRITRVNSVTSTQDVLKEQLSQGAPEGSIVVAQEQSMGRGRRGRSWFSPAGKGLWMSVLIVPEGSETAWTWAPLWAGISVKKAIDQIVNKNEKNNQYNISLKWPNDVIIRDRKLGGILAENVQDNGGHRAVIIGIGLNISQKPEDFPPYLRRQSISLLDVTGEAYSAETVLDQIILTFDEMYSLLKPVAPQYISELWLESAWGLNEPLRVISGKECYEGRFTSLGPNGELCLQLNNHEIVSIAGSDGIQRLAKP